MNLRKPNRHDGATAKNPVSPLRWIAVLLRIGLGGLFLLAGGSKLAAPNDFARHISEFGIVPEPLELSTALAAAIVEAVAAIALLLNLRGCVALAGVLLAGFSAVLVYGLWQGLDIDCGCIIATQIAGLDSDLQTALVRNAVLLLCCGLLSALGFIESRRTTDAAFE